MKYCAIDCGYGFTKFTWLSPSGEMQMDAFRSIAELVAGRPTTFSDLVGRDTFYVPVEDSIYQVGKGITGAAATSSILSADYPLTQQYAALTRGAMAYMHERTGEKQIQRLALGLPVTTFPTYRNSLRSRLIGAHLVPTRGGNVIEVEVQDAVVIPQPAGAFLTWRKHAKASGNSPGNADLVIVIDFGELTIDWLSVMDGKVLYERSGAHHGGTSDIYRFCNKQFEVDHKMYDLNPELIRAGLKNGYVTLHNKKVDFSKYIALAKNRARNVLEQVMVKAGSMADVSRLVISGGGASMFREAIVEKFGDHFDEPGCDPQFANVRGFMLSIANGTK